MERLRGAVWDGGESAELTGEREADWVARQPSTGDPALRFVEELEKVGGVVAGAADWAALPGVIGPWIGEYGIASVMTGGNPRLEPLREALAAERGVALHRYNGTLEEQREEIFTVDCGITTSVGAIAETGSVLLVPTPEEPRLLSLAMPVHIALVEKERIFATLGGYLETGEYQAAPPANLVLASGASRTADIELTLSVGVHGPKVFLVVIIG